MHGIEFTVVLVVGLALTIGAAMRMLGSRIKVPFTVAMLLIGLAAGWWLRDHGAGADGAHMGLLERLGSASGISSDLIIFIFLPALIFESAFAMNVHAFRKALGIAITLAVPALLVATFLTAFLAQAVMPAAWGWSFTIMLVFGALISATDPVAVVALMRELGVSKKMATLVEGESLLNDGTAIVIFSVLVGLAADPSASFELAPVIVQFVKVVAGGLLVGVVLSALVSWWIGRSVNDPLVEITLTLVLGYAAMFIAEGLFHVSGVMALVVSGLWMAGPGRTKISPEVHHFLHQFWEMLAYIANTLVFFLVGLVVGSQFGGATLADAGIIVALWAGIMVIRAICTFSFRPIANALSPEKMTMSDGIVVTWGGLRGAVSMALALIVSQNDQIPREISEKLLLVTAGVVLMTLVVNGTTTGAVLRHFGYDKPPLSEQLAALSARGTALSGVSSGLQRLASSRELRTVKWADVQSGVTRRRAELDTEATRVGRELESASDAEKEAGYWRQAVSVERGAYWHAFEEGTLGAAAVRVLDHELELQLDRLAHHDITPPDTRLPALGPLQAWLRRTIRSQDWYTKNFAPIEFNNLAMLYDLSRGEASAAAAVLESLEHLEGMDEGVKGRIRDAYRGYLQAGKERLEEMRVNLPEITEAIEKRIAETLALQLERSQYEHLSHHGTLDPSQGERLVRDVDERIARLRQAPTRLPMPDALALLRGVPLFEPLDDVRIAELAKSAGRIVVPKGEYLFHTGDSGDSLFVVARGAVHVLREIEGQEVLVDVLGGGDILGEMALLTGEARNASIRAASTVTLVKLGREDFLRLFEGHADVERDVWDAFARRRGDNFLGAQPRFRHLDRDARIAWCGGREHVVLAKGDKHTVGDGVSHVLVLTGAVFTSDGRHPAPDVLSVAAGDEIEATVDARLVLLPAGPAA
jgi:NhaP-type Na+/H+ or K+/H+ antiporter